MQFYRFDLEYHRSDYVNAVEILAYCGMGSREGSGSHLDGDRHCT